MKTLATHELQYVSGAGYFDREPGWGATIGGIAGGFFGPWGTAAGAAIGHGVQTTDWDAVALNHSRRVRDRVNRGEIVPD